MRTAVHLVFPGDVDDPGSPSGGNAYDRRLAAGLPTAVREHRVDGAWPWPDARARARLAEVLAALPDGAPVLLDGLVACSAPEAVVPEAGRLRPVVLVHLPLGADTGLGKDDAADLDARERATLRAATAVVATSAAAARRLVERHGLPAERVHVAPPGVDPAPETIGSRAADRLLCVAAVTPRKGQDVLVRALATLGDLRWTCACVGDIRVPAYADEVRKLIAAHGLTEVRLAGPLTGEDLAAAYAAADLLVLPSHAETYGMVVTEALARAVPVVASDVDGVREAMGRAGSGRPGRLVPPGDPDALAGALRRWLTDAGLRSRLRAAARERRRTLPRWAATVRAVAAVLDEVANGGRS
jgi:glycosyltransferase involved in cell wall biosynthesis